MLTGNICKSSIAGSVMEGGVASTLYAGSLKHSGSFTCVMAIPTNVSARCGCSGVILLSVKRRHNNGAIMEIYTKRIWSFFPVARANFFSVANDGPLTPEARLLSILVMAVAFVPMRSATSAWVKPASLRAASISSSSANSSAIASYSALKVGSSIHLAAISSCVMVGGLRLPVMLNLLHSGFSLFAFSWWSFLSLLDETVQHDDAFSCQGAVKDACDAITAFNPKLEKPVTEGAGMRFSEIAAVYLHAFNKMLVSGTHTQWKLIDLQSDLFTVVLNSVVHELKHNKIVMFTQCVDSSIPGRYTVSAPYKAGAGIGVLEFNIEHNRAHAIFSCHEHCYAQIMVGRAGASQDAPGSMLTGYANPVRLTTSVIGVPCGEFFEFNIGAVDMTTTTNHPYLKIEIVNSKAATTSLFEYLKLLRLAGVPGYISRVAVNPATGLRIPKHHTGLTRHKRVFLSAHVCSMAAQMGASSEAPVFPCVSGNANPVWAATNHGFASVGGSCKAHTQGAVTMTTTTNHPFLKIEIVNGKAVIFSLHVACHFKRMHQNIVDKIEYLNCSREFFTRNFIPGTYHVYGDSLHGYYITLDGLMILQLGLSLRTMRYYESCIEAFHEAETSLNHTAFRRNQREVRHAQ